MNPGLRRQHNATLPVSKLSDDLLWRVFQLNSETLHILPASSSRASEQQAAAEVCHRWRAVALSAPTLWNRVAVAKGSSPAAVQECIRRSAQAPLDLTLSSYDPRPPAPPSRALQLILRQLHRIRVLHISMLAGKFVSETFWPKKASAPLLERLELYKSPFAMASQIDMRSFMKPLSGSLPALRTVEIFNFPLQFDSWFLPATLTSLTWKGPSGYHTSLNDILRVLGNFPRLQTLSLSPIEFSTTLAAQTAQEISHVTLSHLQRLSLQDSTVSALDLLDRLVFPPLKSLCLELSSGTYRELGAHPTFIWHVEAMEVPPRAIAAGFLQPPRPRNGGFVLQAWHENCSLQHMRKALEYRRNPLVGSDAKTTLISLTLMVDVEDHEDDFTPIENLLKIIPFSDLETLLIRLDRPHRAYFDLAEPFHQMKKLQTLAMGDSAIAGEDVGAMSALETILAPSHDIVFPELRVLHLNNMYFRKTAAFTNVLKQRQNQAQIERLELRDCRGLTRKDLEDIRDIIDVDWDEKTIDEDRLLLHDTK